MNFISLKNNDDFNELIALSFRDNKTIICSGKSEKETIIQKAASIGIEIPEPITHADFINKEYNEDEISGFILYSIEVFLRKFCKNETPVDTVAFTGKEGAQDDIPNKRTKQEHDDVVKRHRKVLETIRTSRLPGEVIDISFIDMNIEKCILKAYNIFVAYLYDDIVVSSSKMLERLCFHFECNLYCRTNDTYYLIVKFIV